MDSRKYFFFLGESSSSSSPKKKAKMDQNEEYFPKWSELPNHITAMISDRLDFPDILRFGSVCMPWRYVATETRRRHRLSSQPYNSMVLFEYNLVRGTFGFFSLEENKVYWISIGGCLAAHCIRSTEGWLVLLSPYLTYCIILNPFTGTKIDLPFINNPEVDDFSKVILLSSPIDSKKKNYDCTIVALNYTNQQVVNFCRLGDRSWTVMKLDGYGIFICSLVYHKGKIYLFSTMRELWMINLAGSKASARKCKVTFPLNFSNSPEYHVDCYLVESGDDLLLVLRLKRKVLKKTVGFFIFKLVENHHKGSDGSNAAEYIWVKEPSLADNQALFLGKLCSKSVSTTKFHGLQGNSIYFTDDKLLKSNILKLAFTMLAVETLSLIFHLVFIRSTCRTFGSSPQFEIGTLVTLQKDGLSGVNYDGETD